MLGKLKQLIIPSRKPLIYTISGDEALDIREFLDACNGDKALQSEYLLWDYIHSNYPATRAGNWKIEACRGTQVKIIEVV